MNLLTKGRIVLSLLRMRLTWNRRDTQFRFTVPDNPKFMGSRDAVKLIEDGAVIGISGLGGNQHPTIMYWAIKELFEETGRPRDLTVLCIGGQGGRGIAPGTVDELGLSGLCTRFITGHFETFKNVLGLAEKGEIELQCLPQGTLALLIDAQGRGEDSVVVKTGVGTFLDPAVGRGTPLAGKDAEQLVSSMNGELRYQAPKITVTVFNAPAADRLGNIYLKGCTMIAEIPELVRAVRKNGGTVIANVGVIVEEGYAEIAVRAEDVDAVVLSPGGSQERLSKLGSLMTLESDIPLREGYEQMRFINAFLGLTPRRSDMDRAMARLAATVFAEHAPKGAFVNVGTGLPEQVCHEVYEGGLLDDITFFTESGVVGGIPGPGIFFGVAARPREMMTSAQIFKKAHRELDVTMLGMLQVDGEGNVNASKRGDGPLNYVGPGGFIDFSTSAKVVIFVGNWMTRSKMELRGGRVAMVEKGAPKFVEKVDEITFSGKEALKAGRKVFYATHVGLFRLTERGVELVSVMPGIDVEQDILAASPMEIVLPESGEVPEVKDSIVTGDGFSLAIENPV